MGRSRQIFSRGWLGRSLSVFTFGYYPSGFYAIGKLCHGSIIMTIPGITVGISIPATTVVFEDCD